MANNRTVLVGFQSASDGEIDLPSAWTWVRHYVRGINEHNVDVPCGTCSACCRTGYDIKLINEDDQALMHDENGVLKKKADGSCWYLGDSGCEVYARRPTECRDYDCRAFAYCGIRLRADRKPERAVLNEAIAKWRLLEAVKEPKDLRMLVFLRSCALELSMAGGDAETNCMVGAQMAWHLFPEYEPALIAMQQKRPSPAEAVRLGYEFSSLLRADPRVKEICRRAIAALRD